MFAVPRVIDGAPDNDAVWFYPLPGDAEKLDRAFNRVSDYFGR